AAAYEQLASIYTNRRQFPKAATVWRELIARHELQPEDYRSKQLEQIVKNWGRFEPVGVFAAGESVELPFRFRNADRVEFTARRLDVEQLLTDVKDYIKNIARGSQHLDWQKLNIHDIGQRIIHQNEAKYIKEQVAAWNVALKPLPEHKDDLLMVTPPLENGGAYLVEASIEGGNTTRIIVWLADLAIVKKPVDGRDMIYVADAATGQAIPQANVEFFGYRNEHVEKQTYRTRFSQFAKFTDQNGLIYSDKRLIDANMNWLTIARKGDRFAFHGYLYFSRHGQASEQPQETKLYVVTDRPVYRPGDSVKLKFWVRTPSYDPDAKEPFLKESLTLDVRNPKGEKLLEKQVTTDQYGGYADELELDDNATLGVYQVLVYRTGVFHGSGSFRVEEYKKPEYEVTVDAPSEPVKLGEQVTAKIVAKYYFGAPVTNAKVHYKVTRTPHDSRWYPIQPWDWFYETGYWWFGYDYAWYPGWHKWGCYSPIRSWWNWQVDPPEIVMEDDVEIGPDGTVEIKIDTAPALAAHGDQDHKYEVTAEVVDESRRTIVGQGSVLVSRAPFKVFAWPNKGYYLEGDTAEFQFKAQTLDRKPVTGKGIARLFQVAYDQNGEPQETEVETWDLDPTPEGTASLKLATRRAGQYRLSYTLTDDKQNEIEGAYVFLVRGEGFDASEFRFNELELIAEKKEYQPGEKVKLLINTNRTGATVLLFPRSANGVSSAPIVLRMAGKSTVYELDVREGDRPNFFVEALTVFDGKVHMQAREVIVPPAKKIINVAVESAEPEYQPGQDSKLQLKFTTEEGEPFVGSTILAVYDKAVEYISGGSNASDIREFFWKWRRNYYQSYESSLQRYFYALYRNGELQMSDLGVFGGILERLEFGDEFKKDGVANRQDIRRGAPGMGGYAAAPAAEAAMEKADAAKMPMAQSKAGTPIGMPGPAGATVEPTVRKNFADTAYWSTEITTNAEGLAEVSFPLPESLTTWKTRVWTMGQAAEVGEGTTEFVTKKNVIVRLQGPRFFTQKDEVVLSANVHNYLAESKQVTAVLELDGGQLTPLDELTRSIEVPAGGETRVDWRVKAVEEGNVTIRVKALTDTESDAMQMEFPVYVHGILKTESYTGVVRTGTDSAKVELDVPAERRINQTRLEVRYSPTLAGAMVDALPYLADYPYGCTEQTLNRFLPTVITQNILKRMNLDLKEIKEKRTNLNAQEIGDDVERAKQ
ncbi:MAG TPA: MG2 domain-containing protein, partial [Planctomycetaceae bacterium]|nr:MG2 domain-containing protein [Planctomycetaceae bacterium]